MLSVGSKIIRGTKEHLRSSPTLLRYDLADTLFAQVVGVATSCIRLHHGQTESYMLNVLRIDLAIAVFNGFASSVHSGASVVSYIGDWRWAIGYWLLAIGYGQR